MSDNGKQEWPVSNEQLAAHLKRAGERSASWREKRDELIREAHEQGAGVREIARLVGMSHPGVIRIVNARNHGTNVMRQDT